MFDKDGPAVTGQPCYDTLNEGRQSGPADTAGRSKTSRGAVGEGSKKRDRRGREETTQAQEAQAKDTAASVICS